MRTAACHTNLFSEVGNLGGRNGIFGAKKYCQKYKRCISSKLCRGRRGLPRRRVVRLRLSVGALLCIRNLFHQKMLPKIQMETNKKQGWEYRKEKECMQIWHF